MSERIKNDDVETAFETLREAATEAQINGADQWDLFFGRSSEGYTCWITQGQRRVSDNLGRSKREAAAAMLNMANGINMALHPEPAPARRGRRQITAAVAK